MSTAFLDRKRDQTECDGEHRHANHARKNIHRGLAGKAKALLLGIGLQIIARGQRIGKGRGIEADRSLQAVVASLLNGGRGALGVPLTPGVTGGKQAERRSHDKHGDQNERGNQGSLLGGTIGGKLAIGGFGVDILGRRKAMLLYTFLWSAAMLLFATTDSYLLLLVGMFFAMGTSTLLNTNMNLITTGMFAVAPGFFVNFLFFIQGIGTSGSQSIIGNWATDISSWHTVAWGLLAIGAVAMVLFVLFPMPEVQEHKTEGKVSPKEIMSCPAFLSLVLIIGLYFIAEHGIMNWLVSYATNALEVPMGQAANFTAVFFGCVMVGRLVLSSLVDKLGIYRCLRLFATSAAVLYTAGVLLGAPGLWLLAVSGLLFSILYPTLVMLIPRYWPSHAASSASGLVLSVASLADILFNAVFGSLVDAIGYRTSFLIMPACMVGCTALLWLFFAKAKKLERCD